MAKYYYDKYNAITTYQDTAPWVYQNDTSASSINAFPGYTFDPSNNTYILAGTPTQIFWSAAYGLNLVSGTGATLTAYEPIQTGTNTWKIHKKSNTGNAVSYSKGSLVQSNIIAEDGTYPANGRAADGYWYVRGVLVFPAIKVNIGGVWKAGAAGSVNIDAVWKNFYDMWVNENVVWKKS